MKILTILLFFISINFQTFSQENDSKEISLEIGKINLKNNYAYELVHVAFAILDTNIFFGNLNAEYLTNRDIAYYNEVKSSFSKFKNHPFILKLDEKLRKSWKIYLAQNIQAYNSKFEKNKIQTDNKTSIIYQLFSKIYSQNRRTLNSFSKDINFKEFYFNHLDYYKSELIKISKIEKLEYSVNWLDSVFKNNYKKIDIFISPLTGGFHFNLNKEQKKECVFFVNRLKDSSSYFERAIYVCQYFTELDHNYVNPISENYSKKLNQIFGNKNKHIWFDTVNPQYSIYNSGFDVFNEYMTWSIYLIYCQSAYPKDIYEKIEKTKFEQMENDRGFKLFSLFHTEMKNLFYTQKNSIELLFKNSVNFSESYIRDNSSLTDSR